MIRLEEIQSIGAFTMAVFAMGVALSPRAKVIGKEKEYAIMKKSRWMLFAGLMILSVHYVLQRAFGFRHMGEQQGPFVNILLYTPSVLLMNFSIINLLRFGKIKTSEYLLGIGVIATHITALCVAAAISGKGFLTDSPELLMAEYFSSAVSSAMLLFYGFLARKEYVKIKESLDRFYDQPQQQMIRWLAVSMSMFMLLALTTPVMIYSQHLMLALYGALMFFAISFLVLNFLHYTSTNYMHMMLAAREDAAKEMDGSEEEMTPLTPQNRSDIDDKIAAWLSTRSYLRNGITMAEVAQEIGISRQDVTRFLRSHNYSKIGSWLAALRIEEAKRLLIDNPQFTHEAIAEKCGFSSRIYFQTTFRNLVGMTPLQWQNSSARGGE